VSKVRGSEIYRTVRTRGQNLLSGSKLEGKDDATDDDSKVDEAVAGWHAEDFFDYAQ
jgi:hypothetical protein